MWDRHISLIPKSIGYRLLGLANSVDRLFLEFAQKIARRFAGNPDITVHPVGLGARSETSVVSVIGDGSSSLRAGTSKERVPLVAMEEWCKRHDVREIALIKINIDGGEYPLLDHIIDTGLINHIRELQIQFHDLVPNALSCMQEIQRRLLATHQPTWQYRYVWENWKRIA